MPIRFWRREPDRVPPATVVPLPKPRPSWENSPTRIFPTMAPGRTGNLTPGQRCRSGGWRPGQR